jgi:hypothetical protein
MSADNSFPHCLKGKNKLRCQDIEAKAVQILLVALVAFKQNVISQN